MQVIEIMGILPNGVCGSARSNELMDPQFTDYFPSETEGPQSESESESESGDISQFTDYITKYRLLWVSGTEIPWFNHQSVEHNSILFWVGRKFPKLAVYIVFISINGCKKRICMPQHIFRNAYNLLLLYSPPQRFLLQKLNKTKPTDQNHVEVTYKIQFRRYDSAFDETLIATRWGST